MQIRRSPRNGDQRSCRPLTNSQLFGGYEPVITDKRLLWPDTLSWGPNGDLYVTASQIENIPRFNNGKSTRTEPYKLWKIIGIEKSD
ncbi:MAG: hypothetical protein DME92_01405 [Verrucomicrobia bacterium]|nr:MAG: hypothetical protein DME92_01405 [Verrucomicrobiota bacterium]